MVQIELQRTSRFWVLSLSLAVDLPPVQPPFKDPSRCSTPIITSDSEDPAACQMSDIYYRYLKGLCSPVGSNSVEVVETLDKGQGLVASRDFADGELILVEPPLCTCSIFDTEIQSNGYTCECCIGEMDADPASPGSSSSCSHCGEGFCSLWCSIRSAALHATSLCKSAAWASYKAEARCSENEYFILAARLFFTLEACVAKGTYGLPWGHFISAPWFELTGPHDDDSIEEARVLTRRQYCHLSSIAPRSAANGLLTPETLSLTMGMLRMNVLGCRRSQDNEPSLALYPLQSRTNHSCDPCGIMTFEGDLPGVQSVGSTGGMAMLRARRPIKCGEAITIDYDAGFAGTIEQKHQRLNEHYRFCCDCAS